MSAQRYMLDTNIVSDLMRNPQGRVFDQILQVGSDRLCVSVITAAEIRYGCAEKGSARLLAQAEAILDSGVDAYFSICPGPTTLDHALDHADAWLALAAEQATRAFRAGRRPG